MASRELKLYYNDELINSTTSQGHLGTILDQHLLFNSDFDKKIQKSIKQARPFTEVNVTP